MAITAPPDTPELPTPPSTSSPADFDYKADAFLAALPTFKTSLEAIADNAYDNATEAYGQAGSAATYATNAAASATSASGFASAAAAASGATQWVSGNYTTGDVVWSPADGKVYRRKAPGGSSPTDPSNDLTNWFALAASQTPPVITLTASVAVPDGTRSVRFVVVTDGITITLPPNPQAGDSIGVIDKSGAASPTMTIARNGKNIETLAENLSVNYGGASFALTYFDATRGWVVTAYQNLDGTVVFPSGAFVDTTSTQTLSGKTLASPTITGNALFTSGTFGYGAGAGGSVTQAATPAASIVGGATYVITTVGTTNFVAIGAASNTVGVKFTASGPGTGTGTASFSKSTSVTLNKPSGQITLNNAELAAGATVEFSLNNSTMSATDLLVLKPSGFAGYAVEVAYFNSATEVVIRVTNKGATRTDALAIVFAVIKGATT